MKVMAAWSGGKESCLACHKAKLEGHDLAHIVNFVWGETGRVSFHGTRAEVISAQARAIGVPLVQRAVSPETAYEGTFKATVSELRRGGVEGMVFGDIYIDEHRQWVERVCAEVGVSPVMPLWGMEPERVLRDFVEAGFEALVTSANADVLGEEWLGRRVDESFLDDLGKLACDGDVDVCGERGEYHTLVVDGPPFRRRLRFVRGEKTRRDGYCFLDILPDTADGPDGPRGSAEQNGGEPPP